jgi:hypothetical protein
MRVLPTILAATSLTLSGGVDQFNFSKWAIAFACDNDCDQSTYVWFVASGVGYNHG